MLLFRGEPLLRWTAILFLPLEEIAPPFHVRTHTGEEYSSLRPEFVVFTKSPPRCTLECRTQAFLSICTSPRLHPRFVDSSSRNTRDMLYCGVSTVYRVFKDSKFSRILFLYSNAFGTEESAIGH